MKILLVEDDPRVSSFIKRGLKEEQFTVDVAPDGEQALFLAQTNEYDLMILDLMIPKKSGLEVLKTLRSEGAVFPILILTAKDELEDKVTGLNSGADDYLTKPFQFEELLARVHALMRRKPSLVPNILKVADLEMNPIKRTVTRGRKLISLTTREYNLLEFFLHHMNEVVTRSALSEHVWEHDFDTFSNVIDVHVARLRKKIDEGFSVKLLHTVRGSGYILQSKESLQET